MIISDFDMAAIEPVLFTKTFRESIFKVMLKPLIDKGIYDFVLIDTNPTLGLLNFNILNASNYVIVPVEMIIWCYRVRDINKVLLMMLGEQILT